MGKLKIWSNKPISPTGRTGRNVGSDSELQTGPGSGGGGADGGNAGAANVGKVVLPTPPQPLPTKLRQGTPRPHNQRPIVGLYPTINRQWLAKQTGLHEVTVCRLLRGMRGMPKPDNLAKLAAAIGTTPKRLANAIRREVEKNK